MLERLERLHRPELVADFQQFYSIDLFEADLFAAQGRDLRRISLLCAQLPRESRCARAENPDMEWSIAEHMLASIEYHVRWLAWSRSEDAEQKRNMPQPIPKPSELAERRRKVAATDKDLVDKLLGGA